MTDSCALCDRDAIDIVYSLPEWTTYLREERDMDWKPGSLVIPVCQGCFGRVDMLKESQPDLAYYSEEEARMIETDIEKMLDEIEISRLQDDTPD